MTNLGALVTRIRLFYDPSREPLRRSVYTSLTALIAAAVALGLITGAAAIPLAVAGAAVLMVPATEVARSKVRPVASTYGEHSR